MLPDASPEQGARYTYCREVLQLSESESYNRIEAARAARKFPMILDVLGDGSAAHRCLWTEQAGSRGARGPALPAA
jgi:hypothetical protein